jgi:hypothetical protein
MEIKPLSSAEHINDQGATPAAKVHSGDSPNGANAATDPCFPSIIEASDIHLPRRASSSSEVFSQRLPSRTASVSAACCTDLPTDFDELLRVFPVAGLSIEAADAVEKTSVAAGEIDSNKPVRMDHPAEFGAGRRLRHVEDSSSDSSSSSSDGGNLSYETIAVLYGERLNSISGELKALKDDIVASKSQNDVKNVNSLASELKALKDDIELSAILERVLVHRVDDVEERLNGVEQHFKGKNGLDAHALHGRIDDVLDKLRDVERRFKNRSDRFDERLQDSELDIDAMGTNVRSDINNLRTITDHLFEKVDALQKLGTKGAARK